MQFNDLRPDMEVILKLEDGTHVEGVVFEVLSIKVTIRKSNGRFVEFWRADIANIYKKEAK